LKSYSNKIVYLEQKNAGPAVARNLGIDKARGDFIGFLDADDVWFPKKLQKQIAFMNDNPTYGLVYCDRAKGVGNKYAHQLNGKLSK